MWVTPQVAIVLTYAKAMSKARDIGCHTLGLTGSHGGELKQHAHTCIQVPSTVTARIQEAHAFIGHMLCAIVDEAYQQ